MAEGGLRDLPDERLIGEVAAATPEAFEELLRRYEGPVLTFCYAFVRDRASAEDMAQETFLRVFRNAARYQPVAKFTTWLYTIAANLCINELKKLKHRPSVSLDEPAGDDPQGTRIIERLRGSARAPPSETELREAGSLIRRAIDHLPYDQRTTLIMVEYHHLQYQEIAEILGVTVSAIKMRVKRGRETLREALKVLQAERKP
jgi:RNA polymerase sigma-70 factor (ECF subfamily)